MPGTTQTSIKIHVKWNVSLIYTLQNLSINIVIDGEIVNTIETMSGMISV